MAREYAGTASNRRIPSTKKRSKIFVHTNDHVAPPPRLPWQQQPTPVGAGGSPDALLGRLYAGRGRQQHLAENSPPRNTSFGTSTAHNRHQQDGGGGAYESTASPVGGVSGLMRSRAGAASSLARDSLTEQQQQYVLVPRLYHRQPSGPSLPTGSGAAPSSGSGPHQQQRVDGINSPPRIGVRRRSSGMRRSATESGVIGPTTGSKGSSSVAAAGYQPQKKQPGSSAHHQQQQQQQPSIGGGMMLSRSLGALGQAGAGRSTLAIVNTRDDGAPYLRSEKMSPKSSTRAPTCVTSKRSLGRGPSRLIIVAYWFL